MYGNSFESSLVAVVVPKEEALKDWAASHSHGSASFEELCKKPEAKQFILQACSACLRLPCSTCTPQASRYVFGKQEHTSCSDCRIHRITLFAARFISNTIVCCIHAVQSEVNACVQALTEQAKLSKLRGFEFIKNVHLDSEEFSVENDTLTPTFKLRRPQLKDRYNSVIDDMYKALKP